MQFGMLQHNALADIMAKVGTTTCDQSDRGPADGNSLEPIATLSEIDAQVGWPSVGA